MMQCQNLYKSSSKQTIQTICILIHMIPFNFVLIIKKSDALHEHILHKIGVLFGLNSKTEIKSYDILYGSNQGHISAVSYGKVLIVEGYVTAQNTGSQYVLAKINDINAINVTQIIFQVGSMPTDPYCMFGSIELDGKITIGSSTQNTLYRLSAAVLIK